jgi:hypothetical protein
LYEEEWTARDVDLYYAWNRLESQQVTQIWSEDERSWDLTVNDPNLNISAATEFETCQGIYLYLYSLLEQSKIWFQGRKRPLLPYQPNLPFVDYIQLGAPQRRHIIVWGTHNTWNKQSIRAYDSVPQFIEKETDFSFCKVWFDGDHLHLSDINAMFSKRCSLNMRDYNLNECYYGLVRDLPDINTRMFRRVEKYRARGFQIDSDLPDLEQEAEKAFYALRVEPILSRKQTRDQEDIEAIYLAEQLEETTDYDSKETNAVWRYRAAQKAKDKRHKFLTQKAFKHV